MDEVEYQQPRLGASAAVALLATVLLTGAISYNALWRQSLGERLFDDPMAASEDIPAGSTRVVVDLDQPQPATVTLRYDATVEAVQRELAASGIYEGPIDGVTGRRTQLAILAYQRASGLDQTGTASPELVDHIQLARQFAVIADTTGSLPDNSGGSIKSAQMRLDELGYDPGAIDGELGAQTQIAIRQFQHDHGLKTTGRLSGELIVELNKAGATHANP